MDGQSVQIRTVSLLVDSGNVLLVELEVHGDGGGLDGDTTVDLILPGVHVSGISSPCRCDDTSLGDEGIRESRLSVIDCVKEELGRLANQAVRTQKRTVGDNTLLTGTIECVDQDR